MTFAGIVNNLVNILNTGVIPLMYALAFLFIIYGITRYFFLGGASPESQEKGRKVILYGIIGLVVIFAVWGIVNIGLSTLTSIAGTS